MGIEPLVITYQGQGGAAAAGDIWLQAEQANTPGDGKISWLQLQAMLRYARSGMSATTVLVDDCPVEIEGDVVRVILQLNVYPSEVTLPYGLDPAYGVIGAEVREVIAPREFDLVFDMSTSAAADKLLIAADTISYEWCSPVWDKGLRKITAPEIRYVGGKFVVDEPVFGIARVACQALGWQHDIVMELPRLENQRYSDLQNKVQVSWRDEAGQSQTEVVDLKIPPCVEQLLTYCTKGGGVDFGRRNPTTTQVRVYYNECTSKAITTVVTPPKREAQESDG